MPSLINQTLGRYHITEQIGEGGMATVYKAYDTRLERDVAVKVIRVDQFSPDALERVLQRFEREAKSLAKLSHPNIVGVIDYGDYEGVPFLVMEYLPGGSLKDMLGKPMPWQKAARLLLPIASGLAYAHQRGIIHRDVKPSNILIGDSGEPMLADFGIAKILESTDAQTLTGTGIGVGTPEYMSPEQWKGDTTTQSDIYSLGVVFYELVTGRKPYSADTPVALMLKQATEPLPRPASLVPNLPKDIEEVILKALSKEPISRYPDMAGFINALEIVQNRAGNLNPRMTGARLAGINMATAGDTQRTSEQTDTQGAQEEYFQDEGKFIPNRQVNLPSQTTSPIKKSRFPGWLIWIGSAGVMVILGLFVLVMILSKISAAPGQDSLVVPEYQPQDTLTNYVPTFSTLTDIIFTPSPYIETTSPLPLIPTVTSTKSTRYTVSIGASVEGRELVITCLGNGIYTLVVAAAIHGDEANTTELVEELRQKVIEVPLDANYTLCFLPGLNPDGLAKNSRKNAHGIDLNRNWDTENWKIDSQGPSGTTIGGGGSHPFSEPETQAFSSWLLGLNEQIPGQFAVIMYHSAYPPAGLVQPGYTKPSGTAIPDWQSADLARSFSDRMSFTYSEIYPPYEITGEMINWCAEQGIGCFDVELPDHNSPGISAVQQHYNALLYLLGYLSTMH